MAYNNHTTSAVLLLALFLFTAANPFVHGQNNTILGLSVIGRLCCTPTGNCPGQGVGGTTVGLACNVNGVTVNIGSASTNTIGSFNITGRATGLALNQTLLRCIVTARLSPPSFACPRLPNAILVSPVQSAGTFLTRQFGLVRNATAIGFIRIPAQL